MITLLFKVGTGLVCLILLLSADSDAQNPLSSLDITGGINFEFGYDWNGSSYVSVSIAGGVSKNFYHDVVELKKYQRFFKENTSPSYQAALNIYFNSIGDNILDDFKKVNIDFVHSMMFSLGKNMDTTALDQIELVIRPFNSQTASVVKDNMSSSLTVGTNFVLNNSARNQRVGFMNVNLGRFMVAHYYNDGPPYTRFSSDGYDRWWTGGGSLDVYFNQLFKNDLNFFTNSRVSVSYDRFTGNVQNAFLAADVFGFYYVPTKDLKQNFYNRSKFKVGIRFFEDDFEISAVKLGKLRNEVQDYIHGITANPVHLTYSKGNWLLGVNYNPIRELPNMN